MLRAIIRLTDACGAKRVGGDDVGTGLKIGARDAFHDVRPRQRQNVVIPLLVMR